MSTTESRALTAANERQIVDAFRAISAVSQKSAKMLRDLNLNDSRPLRDLVGTGIIRRVGTNRYFLDEQKWGLRRQVGGRTLFRALLGAVLIIMVAFFFLQ